MNDLREQIKDILLWAETGKEYTIADQILTIPELKQVKDLLERAEKDGHEVVVVDWEATPEIEWDLPIQVSQSFRNGFWLGRKIMAREMIGEGYAKVVTNVPMSEGE
jgi:hypothetical protein